MSPMASLPAAGDKRHRGYAGGATYRRSECSFAHCVASQSLSKQRRRQILADSGYLLQPILIKMTPCTDEAVR